MLHSLKFFGEKTTKRAVEDRAKKIKASLVFSKVLSQLAHLKVEVASVFRLATCVNYPVAMSTSSVSMGVETVWVDSVFDESPKLTYRARSGDTLGSANLEVFVDKRDLTPSPNPPAYSSGEPSPPSSQLSPTENGVCGQMNGGEYWGAEEYTQLHLR